MRGLPGEGPAARSTDESACQFRASADAEYRLDGVIVELSTVECFKCSGSGGVLTHDALGVDPQKHVHAVPCPLGYLGRRNARVEPH